MRCQSLQSTSWTRRDPILSRLLQFTQHGWPARLRATDKLLKPYWSKWMELSSQSECLLWGGRVIAPEVGQSKVLQELHEAHPGLIQMKRIAWTLVWWPGLDKNIEERVQHCLECQSNQCFPPLSPLQPWKRPTRQWSRLHSDFPGPFMGRMFSLS